MNADLQQLMQRAEAAGASAHAPYSGLHVGAAVRTAGGRIYAGCNVENAAFPLGSCAEANAIAAAVCGEGPDLEITDVAIAARNAAGERIDISPCGGCRQRIVEFGEHIRVHWIDAMAAVHTRTVAELLPARFHLARPTGAASGS